MEVINGVPPAEFGDKDSLVVRITTKSGLDHDKPTGNVTSYGSFKSPTAEANLGIGSHGVGNFITVSGMRTDRFLDPPEFEAIHDAGNSQSIFDRLDVHPNDVDSFHLNLHFGRSSFNVPNTYDADAIGQDQHQKITTINFAPAYSRILSSSLLLTANAFVRQDHLTYTASPDPFSDQPGTAAQDRKLTNIGAKVDLAYVHGAHSVKFGGSIAATKLTENFSLGLTDPTLNSPCVDVDGNPSDNTSLLTPAQCGRARLFANPDFQPGLAPIRPVARRRVVPVQRERDDQAAGVLRSGRDQGRQRDVQPGPARRPLRRPEHQVVDPAAPRRLVRRARQRHDPARVVRTHAGDALQREPRARQQRQRRRCSAPAACLWSRASAIRWTSASSNRSADGSWPT